MNQSTNRTYARYTDKRLENWKSQEIKYLLQTINRPDHAEQYKMTWGKSPYQRLKELEISAS